MGARYPDFDYPVDYPTQAECANDEVDQREYAARLDALAGLEDFPLLQDVQTAGIPLADVFTRGLTREQRIQIYGTCLDAVIENHVAGEVAIRTAKPVHWNTHPEEVDDGPEIVSPADIVRRTLLVLSVQMRIPGGLA